MKSQGGRGIPRKAGNKTRKSRHQRYWDRATCGKCRVVFSTPRRKLLHVDNNHDFKTAAGPIRILYRLAAYQSQLT